MKTITQEWEHIALYQASQADAFKTVLGVAPELSAETKKWLQAKYEIATAQRIEAESNL